MIISASDLQASIQTYPMEFRGMMVDTQYFCPSPAWLGEFVGFLQSMPSFRYRPEVYDCEDFALNAHRLAMRALLLSGRKGVGMAGGIMAVQLTEPTEFLGQIYRGGNMHAVNFFLCSDDRFWLLDSRSYHYEPAKTALRNPGVASPTVLWVHDRPTRPLRPSPHVLIA